MVERLNGNISLEEYMKTHIWAPLGIKDMTFHLEKREDLRARLVDPCVRDAATGKAVHKPTKVWDDPLDDAMGGGGVYSSMPDFFKILLSLLNDDGRLLKSETVQLIVSPQLNDECRASLMRQFEDPEFNNQLGALPLGIKKDWAFGGSLLMEDIKGGRRSGTVAWLGVPNVSWVSCPFRSTREVR